MCLPIDIPVLEIRPLDVTPVGVFEDDAVLLRLAAIASREHTAPKDASRWTEDEEWEW
jgi:hypothetical protein